MTMKKSEFVNRNLAIGDRFRTVNVAWLIRYFDEQVVALVQVAKPYAEAEMPVDEFYDKIQLGEIIPVRTSRAIRELAAE